MRLPSRFTRWLAANWKQTALLCFLVAALVGGQALWFLTHPTTTYTETTTHPQTVTTNVTTQATVTHDTVLYSKGTVVTNGDVYFVEEMPIVGVNATTRMENATAFNATQNMSLVVQASYNGQPIWQETLPLSTETTRTETAISTQALVNITTVRMKIRRVSQKLGGRGAVTASLAITTKYESARYTGVNQTTLPLTISPPIYQLPSGEVRSYTHADHVGHRQVTTSPLTRPLGILALGWALLGGLVVGFGWRTATTTTQQSWEEQTRQHAEWLSEGELPDLTDYTVIPIESLDGLVDVAIDSQRRIIYDPDAEQCGVILHETAYITTPADHAADTDADADSDAAVAE